MSRSYLICLFRDECSRSARYAYGYCRRLMNLYTRLFFFFQAEDGIRDLTVTGVQTCALPISKTQEAVFLVLEVNFFIESAKSGDAVDAAKAGAATEDEVGVFLEQNFFIEEIGRAHV